MSATISDPFLLASYHASSSKGTSKSLQSSTPRIFASYGPGKWRSDGYVTVTAQGDGVHVLEVSTLHPIASHSLGPTTTFAGPAITKVVANTLTSYAIIDSAPDVPREESGRTVWVWKENSDGNPDKSPQKKQTAVIPHPVSSILVSQDIPSHVLLVSPKGDLTIMSNELDVLSTHDASNADDVLFKTFLFPQKSCTTFIGHNAPPNGIVLLCFYLSGDNLRVVASSVGEEGNYTVLGSTKISLDNRDVVGFSCSTSGYLSILFRNGEWQPFQLVSDATSLSISPTSESIRLSLFFTTSSSSHPEDDVSILSLGSSHVILAGFNQEDIVLLIWDLQYGVLLASHSLPVPSTSLGRGKTKIDLTATNASQALLVLSPSDHSKGIPASCRSSVFIVPLTVPEKSTIANAFGRASAGLPWLANSASPQTLDSDKSQLLEDMKTAMSQNHPLQANTAFTAWLNHEQERTHVPPVFDYAFVEQLLHIVLQPSKPSGGSAYSPMIVRHLLEQSVVDAGMVKEVGGLLSALMARNDWTTMEMTLQRVLAIPEADIISALHTVIIHHRQTHRTHLSATRPTDSDDSMEVDPPSTSSVPSLPVFLAQCLTPTTSPQAMRVAVHQHLGDVEDLVCVLEVLEEWLSRWCEKDLRLIPSGTKQMENGVIVAEKVKAKSRKKEKAELTPLPKIVSFLQVMLDSSFLKILQYSPAHPLIHRIVSQITPQLTFTTALEQLRGPLEPFAKAQKKALRKADKGAEKEEQVDWRKKKKAAQVKLDVEVGMYKLEEMQVKKSVAQLVPW